MEFKIILKKLKIVFKEQTIVEKQHFKKLLIYKTIESSNYWHDKMENKKVNIIH